MFRFKHFTIEDEHTAMKIGTDGVLLGAWADVASDCRILDMGTGSGLIAIMSAQRNTDAEIVAIDIVEDAVCEARRNVANSAWRERIEVVHGDVNEWQCEQKFDHIVSNPPFFTEALQSPNEARRTARHATTLTYEDIVAVAERVLLPNGRLSVVLPTECAMMFRRVAFERLWLRRLTDVVTVEGDSPKRTLMEFQLCDKPIMPSCDILTIHHRAGGGYTEQYQSLTRDFYLNF
ncbi:MAG: methyltransferase [Alistipes sp.]|nr:methyltransferase [Alistipes sp.]MBO5855883.1 methyltransferase [Alistipes sp.]